MKRLTLGLVTGAAALALFAGAGTADAAITLLPSSSVPASGTYKDQKITITVTNKSTKKLDCTFGFYESKHLGALQRLIDKAAQDLANAPAGGDPTVGEDEFDSIPMIAEDAGARIAGLLPNTTDMASWVNTTDKAKTELAVLQVCSSEPVVLNPGTPEQEFELSFAASAFKVTEGGGSNAGNSGGNTGGGAGGNGSLDLGDTFGDLFGSLG